MRSQSLLAALLAALLPVASAHALTVTLDGDTAATGSAFATGSSWTSPLGEITFEGEFLSTSEDPEATAAGASGAAFDILGSNTPATLAFSFDVDWISFVYGGNTGDITVQAFDALGEMVDSFHQDSTYSGQPAGPVTLSGLGIRSLSWFDTQGGYAYLDNIVLSGEAAPSAVPLPGAGLLLAGGLAGLAGLRRTRRG